MTQRVTVVGAGYLGTTHAVCMAELGFEVLGMDVDHDRIAALTEGEVPFYEPDLEVLLRKHVETGQLRWSTSYRELAEFGELHFICVGTPQRTGEFAADVSAVDAAVDGLVPWVRAECVIVGKSTVPVGTSARLVERIDELAPAGHEIRLAWNPEFLREGYAVEDILRPDRVVVGVESARAEEAMRAFYAPQLEMDVPFLVTNFATAELAKNAANAYLATKISFINAMAELCEHTGGDVTVLADALGHDARIGRAFLNAGIGFGGGCLPKDVRATMARAGEVGADGILTFLREVDAINTNRRAYTVELAREVCGGSFADVRVGVLGAAFKPDSDDIRDSPALQVAGQLQLGGALVSVYDPKAMENAEGAYPTLEYATSALEACRDADLVLHLTEWREFRDIDPAELARVVADQRIIDGRNTLDSRRWAAAGWDFRALGRG